MYVCIYICIHNTHMYTLMTYTYMRIRIHVIHHHTSIYYMYELARRTRAASWTDGDLHVAAQPRPAAESLVMRTYHSCDYHH